MTIDFSNMLGKPLAHCFVPADQASITFVFQDGMRRSFGVVNSGGTRLTQCAIATDVSELKTEGAIFTEVKNPSPKWDWETDFITPSGTIEFSFPRGGSLVELPE